MSEFQVGPVGLAVAGALDSLFDDNLSEFQKFREEAKKYMSLSSDTGNKLEAKQSVLDALQPVKLDKELYDVYDSTMFPSGRKVATHALEQAGKVAAGLNLMFMFMRSVLENGDSYTYYESVHGKEATANRVKEYALTFMSTASSDISKGLRAHLGGILSQGKYRITKSTFWQGGYDIHTTMSEDDINLVGSDVGYGVTLLQDTESPLYQDERSRKYTTNTALAMLSAARLIYRGIFGGDLGRSKGRTLNASYRFDHDWQQYQRVLEQELGYSLPVQFIPDVEPIKAPKGNTKGKKASMYMPEMFYAMGITVGYSEGSGYMSRVDRGVTYAAREEFPNASDVEVRAILKERYLNTASDESKLLNVIFGGSLVYTLNKDICEFISQSTPADVSGLRNWFRISASQYLRARGLKGEIAVGTMRVRNIPRYTLPLNKLEDIAKEFKASDIVVEQTRANEDNMYLTTTGRLATLPTIDQRESVCNVQEYYDQTTRLNELAEQYGVSPNLLMSEHLQGKVFVATEDVAEINKLREKMQQGAGRILGYDWGLGVTFYSDNNGGIQYVRETGAVKPQDLSIAELLGYNMAKEGEVPSIRTAAEALLLGFDDDPVANARQHDIQTAFGDKVNATTFVGTPHYQRIVQTYLHYSQYADLNIPDLQTMVKKAVAEMKSGIEADTQFHFHPYNNLFDLDGTFSQMAATRIQQGSDYIGAAINELMEVALIQCHTSYGSPLQKKIMRDEGQLGDMDEILNHPQSFVFSEHPLSKMKTSVYNTIGGKVFKQILEVIEGMSFETINNRRVAEDNILPGVVPTPIAIMRDIKPMATLMGKYVEDYEEWVQRADNEINSISYDSSITEDDVNFAGGSGKFSMFPHQLDTQRTLRKSEPPSFAILDIAPGGGKTSIGIVDIACIADDMKKRNEKLIPLVLCPDNLIRNWCDDSNVFTESGWNTIPINSSIVKRWGADRLVEIIRNAPPNTICVAGFNFMNNNKTNIVFGGASVQVGFNVEMLRTIGFNYVIIDESHKLKKLSSQRHRMVKHLTTAPFVKYLRIATGTLIVDRVSDIEGQVALHQPNIFRRGELVSTLVNAEKGAAVDINGEAVELWKVTSPKEARHRLARYAAVITKQRKEWAFMLPSPIETFHSVNMVGSMDDYQDAELLAFDQKHKELYESVLAESVELLEELVSNAKQRDLSDDDDDDGEDDVEADGVNTSTGDLDFTEADEFAFIDPKIVKAHLARLERLIIAPELDEAFKVTFGEGKVYPSRKARKATEIAEQHFIVPAWEKSKHYDEYEQVEHQGKFYLSRKMDLSSVRRIPLPIESVGVPPSENPDHWREEPEGKLIIFCRYTNTVNSVYNALPDNLKAVAVKYTGEEVDKLSNLELFKSDPNVKVLVANEQGLSEGHNLQMASRIIRVESPWGPGEASQTESRIFRPDPKGAKAGEIYREIVYLDWVCTNDTMEIPKFARFIKKSIDAARFDEAENPRYDEALSVELDEVGLGMNMLRTIANLDDVEDYLGAYAGLNGVRNTEFLEMRAKGNAEMVPIPKNPALEGSAVLEVTPFIPSQKIPDREGLKPVPLLTLMRSEEYERFRTDPDSLVGEAVITDMGKGMIVSIRKRYKAKGSKELHEERPVSSLVVRLKNPDGTEGEDITLDNMGLVYIPTAITPAQRKRDFEVPLAYTQAQRRAARREEERLLKLQEELDAKEREEEERKADQDKRIRNRVRDKKVSGEVADIRRRNISSGRPVNQGIEYNENPRVLTGIQEMEEPRAPLELTPAYFHGFLTLETSDLEYERELKKFKFRRQGEFAFIEIKRRNHANKAFDYIEEHFELSSATAKRLGEVFKAFEKGMRGLYNLELAPTEELPHFFAINKKMVTNKREIRLYPLFKDDVLTLICDLRTNPAVRKHIGKTVPGAATKWQKSEGNLLAFVQSKPEMRELVKRIAKSGIELANPKQLNADISAIRHRRTGAKK